ncbi:MAG: hypothetical protein GEV03_27120 [Streptosporangiales bacterium]|nr:hypothetical protein [Streptosporangiales bacterium]
MILVVAIIGTVAAHWPSLDPVTRAIFAGLCALGVVVLARGLLALRAVKQAGSNWQKTYISHIYFTYISLWEGFFIVAVIDLGLPAWLVPVVALVVLVAGAYLLSRYKRKVLPAAGD